MCPAPHHRLPPLTLFLITMSILCRPTNMANAASEDRTHDLRIMRPTRCQLRYRRSMHACHSTSMVARSRGCALASRARPWQHTRNVAARGLRPAHACGARSMRIAPTTLVALASEPPGRGGAAGMASTCVPAAALPHMGLWRNGSACDSRSQGWEFESRWPHSYCACLLYPIHELQHRWVVHINQEWVVVAIGMFVAGAWPLAWRRCTSDRGSVVRSAMDRKCTTLLSSVQRLACGAMAQR